MFYFQVVSWISAFSLFFCLNLRVENVCEPIVVFILKEKKTTNERLAYDESLSYSHY